MDIDGRLYPKSSGGDVAGVTHHGGMPSLGEHVPPSPAPRLQFDGPRWHRPWRQTAPR
jgi:hypothetical protein